MKLSTKIIIFVIGAAVIPLLVIGIVLYSDNKERIIQNTLNELDAIAQIQNNRLEDVLGQKKDLLDLFITNRLIRSYLHDFNISRDPSVREKMNENLSESIGNSNSIIKIFVADNSGTVVASTDQILIGSDISNESFFNKGKTEKDISFLTKDGSGTTLHYLSGPLIIEGKTEGVAILVTSADDIIGLANDYTGLGETGETLVVRDDGDGNALFLTPTRFDRGASLVRKVPKRETNIPAVNVILGKEGTSEDFVDYRHVPIFSSTRYLESIGWGIVVKINKEEALALIDQIQRLLLFIIFGAIAITTIVAIPVSYFISTAEERLIRNKDEFISLASHQLRTPITALSWNLESLLGGDKGEFNPKQKKVLEEIYESSKNMSDLVVGFLDITKIESGGFAVEKGDVSMTQISDSVLSEISNQISDKDLNIVRKYEGDIRADIGDKTARIILQNLITNAVKYTPKKGTVEIKIEKADGSAFISVKDSGYGIPENAKSRIFTKLFRAENIRDKEPSGTGLGLYLVKSLVNKLNGKVWFESEEGVGTTFYVKL